jgi:Zn-finger domain-containing protein
MNINEKHIEEFVDKLHQASIEEPQNCEEVDIRKLEEVGQHIANNMEEFLVNIDIEKS